MPQVKLPIGCDKDPGPVLEPVVRGARSDREHRAGALRLRRGAAPSRHHLSRDPASLVVQVVQVAKKNAL